MLISHLAQCYTRQDYRYTPTSDRLDSDEVLQLTKYWINNCITKHRKCSTSSLVRGFGYHHRTQSRESTSSLMVGPEFYPTRLIELNPKGSIKPLEKAPTNPNIRKPAFRGMSSVEWTELVEENQVRLVETATKKMQGNYVTLSHCWGKAAKFFSLNTSNIDLFKSGLDIRELPRTFRQAISFARRLGDDVNYIWIDSLCIKQDDAADWERESVQMYKVYRNSYCNISATAAADGSQGLYSYREPRNLWESEVNVNTETNRLGLNKKGDKHAHGHFGSLVRRCRVVDPGFWDLKVDNAPVNTRAWVLQERLLAPRVVHFCEDQVAWECAELDASEASADGISRLGHKNGLVQDRVRLKAFTALTSQMETEAHANWKSIVERYSKTSLTKPSDKLIALAGIAELFHEQIAEQRQTQVKYVAGIWETFLASQLLWRVETVYKNEKFQYPSRRPQRDIPSFSWAAIDAPQGIKCGDIVPSKDLLISIGRISIKPKQKSEFGQVEPNASLKLRCQIVKVQLDVSTRLYGDETYTWSLAEGGPRLATRTKKMHPIVYLDSPQDDIESIRLQQGIIYLVPAYKDPAGYLRCLLLQQAKEKDHYRRVGLSIIPPYVSKYSSSFLNSKGEIEIWGDIYEKQEIVLL
ncbi:uncharacterized protein PV09_06649 [Verruconis gallopava]|uniref:Heterokaryon incompatibility domain-containing protein n=1 Tax=Verruconis gallopava TaxID=253628 RepID=A0A0D1XIL2_9PEZI|nr:uncharacterized protein PV09_06649 [Verruconis gallopava]KIW02166.1 hypothetical protein PV09_06649 [Verruconis gallopava]